jgi:hypothetical protein
LGRDVNIVLKLSGVFAWGTEDDIEIGRWREKKAEMWMSTLKVNSGYQSHDKAEECIKITYLRDANVVY